MIKIDAKKTRRARAKRLHTRRFLTTRRGRDALRAQLERSTRRRSSERRPDEE
jgi:hypothetical protein